MRRTASMPKSSLELEQQKSAYPVSADPIPAGRTRRQSIFRRREMCPLTGCTGSKEIRGAWTVEMTFRRSRASGIGFQPKRRRYGDRLVVEVSHVLQQPACRPFQGVSGWDSRGRCWRMWLEGPLCLKMPRLLRPRNLAATRAREFCPLRTEVCRYCISL